LITLLCNHAQQGFDERFFGGGDPAQGKPYKNQNSMPLSFGSSRFRLDILLHHIKSEVKRQTGLSWFYFFQ